MAAITSANVTVIKGWDEGDRTMKWTDSLRRLKIVLAAQGGTVGDIPAAALGLAEIYGVSEATLDVGGTPKATLVFTALNGSELITADLTQATDATRADRANLTGNLYVTVRGRTSK